VAIRFEEFLNNLAMYKRKLGPDELIVLPRLEAHRRAVNKEKRSRVSFVCTPEQYAAFHAQLKRYRDLVPNVTMSTDIMIAYLAQPSDGDIQAVAEEVETGEFAMGRGEPKDSIGE
jgi:hypothetical protein